MKMKLMKFSDVPLGARFIFHTTTGVKISNHTVKSLRKDEPNFICLTEGRHYGHQCTISSEAEVSLIVEETFKT